MAEHAINPGTFCSWEVLPSASWLPIVSSGFTTDPAKARKYVEDTLATRPEAGLGSIARHVTPGSQPDPDDHEWPPVGEVWQCRRARPVGYNWRPLHPKPGPAGPPAQDTQPQHAEPSRAG
jgi:hypothetical protein